MIRDDELQAAVEAGIIGAAARDRLVASRVARRASPTLRRDRNSTFPMCFGTPAR